MTLTWEKMWQDVEKYDKERLELQFKQSVNQQDEFQVQHDPQLKAIQTMHQNVKRKANHQFDQRAKKKARRQTKWQRLPGDIEKLDREEDQKYSRQTNMRLSSTLTWIKNIIFLSMGLALCIIALRIALYTQRDPESERLRVTPSNFSTILNCGQDDVCWQMLTPTQPIRRNIDERYHTEKILIHNDRGTISIVLDKHNETMVMLTSFISPGNRESQPLPHPLKETFDFKAERWPTEISAALAMTWALQHEWPNDHTKTVDNEVGFIPTLDYFLVCLDYKCSKPRWYQVTPLIGKRTLREYGIYLKNNNPMTIQDLDMKFRLSFNKLLYTLSWLHERGICHDYVNPDNIHIHEHETGWYLADYEQVRETTHPYHFSQLWGDPEMWPDCRLNDVRHTIKAYLSFR